MTRPEAADGPAGALSAGATVGRYRLLGPLGEGGMGVVYRAEDVTLGRHAALKFLPRHLASDGAAAARLLAEARAASALDHPHICTIYEVGEADDERVFIAMACYEGESLADRLKRGPLPVEEAVRVAAETASALEAAHAEGIVHRDIKPSNIFLTKRGRTKLLDFGVAKVDGEALTRTGDTLGTIQYMAPEQTRGVVDARGDLWALGAVLYEMVVGERLFKGTYDGALLFDILYQEIDLRPVERAGAPPSVAALIGRCLQRDPAERVESAAALREALETVLEADAPVDVPDVPAAEPPPVAASAAPLAPPAVETSADETPAGEPDRAEPPTSSPPATGPAATPGAVPARSASRRLVLAGAAALAVAGAATVWALAGSDDADVAPDLAAETATLESGAVTAGGGVADSAGAPAPTGTPEATEAALPTAPPQQATVVAPPVQQAPTPVARQPQARPLPGPSQPGPPQPRAAPPQPGTLVSRVGSGVTVSVDGQPVGGSTTIEPGTHTVVFRHPRWGEHRRTVRVGPGETVPLAVHFEAEVRVGARLASGSGPAPFAAVWVDGQNTGAFTPTTLTLGPGRHTVELRRDGYRVLDGPQTITVEPSARAQSHSVSFRLAANAP